MEKIKKSISRKIKIDYDVNLALDLLYIFEQRCPKSKEIIKHISAIEEILQSKIFLDQDKKYMDDILGYELYIVGYDYEWGDY